MNNKESIFLAKKYFVDLIYNSAKIEGCNVTFPQTQTILDGAVINNVSVDDIQTVLNLRDGFRFIINNYNEPLNLDYICKINSFVSRNESLEWGVLRNGEIGISGTDWKPEVPDKYNVEERIEELNKIKDPLERALEFFCFGTRSQLFWDGNKRTSLMVANKILIENNKGILTIGKDNALEFNETLLEYYNTNNSKDLKNCLKRCVRFLELNQQIEQGDTSKFLSSNPEK